MTAREFNSRDAFDSLRRLSLPPGEFAVFGSGPLAVRGVIDRIGDLDVLCRAKAWETVRGIGRIEYLPEYDVEVVHMDDGQLSFGNKWGIGEFDIDELIDTAEMIEDLPFVRLEYVVAYKRLRDSEKDRSHLEALKAGGFIDAGGSLSR